MSPAKAEAHTDPKEIAAAASRGYPYYTYTLADASGVFYVGKGKGNRILQHGKTGLDRNYLKRARLAADGVKRTVVAYFTDSGAALGHEAALMAETEGLTNIAPGSRDPRQKAIDYAKLILSKIVPFECSQLRTRAFDWPSIGFQSAREFYDASIRVLEQEVANPSPTSLTFIQRDGRTTCIQGWD